MWVREFKMSPGRNSKAEKRQMPPAAELPASHQDQRAPADEESPRTQRIILIRHGQPDIAISPRASHHEFRSYIDAYEEAGLDPGSAPPDGAPAPLPPAPSPSERSTSSGVGRSAA